MPRATHPLTPASSTDLKSQDGSKQLASLQMSFELPPPALSGAQAKASPADSESSPRQSQAKTQYPLQASETVKSRRRPSTLQGSAALVTAAKDSFALPPPPTRSRKIIQMQPRTQDETEVQSSGGGSGGKSGGAKSSAAAVGSEAAVGGSSTGAGASAAGKKKQSSATSAAGRKMARKTAHSLIERRRRSKMNEEFATLKNMIPACTGEMHKLAILQASIEYVRYLEDCVSKLKAQREDASAPMELAPPPMTTYDGADEDQHHRIGSGPGYDAYMANSGDDDEDGDVDMHGGAELPSPTFTAEAAAAAAHAAASSTTHSTSVSPALLGADSRRQRHDSYSSAVSTPVLGPDGRRCSLASATTPSPAFGPQTYPAGLPYSSRPGSALTSPALQPLRDVDHEATAALLMLNSDRRGAANGPVGASGAGSSTGRGMSVRDLLST
ncbi:hypothetical protein RB597_008568 [Gaeumannomyces tritici]